MVRTQVVAGSIPAEGISFQQQIVKEQVRKPVVSLRAIIADESRPRQGTVIVFLGHCRNRTSINSLQMSRFAIKLSGQTPARVCCRGSHRGFTSPSYHRRQLVALLIRFTAGGRRKEHGYRNVWWLVRCHLLTSRRRSARHVQRCLNHFAVFALG